MRVLTTVIPFWRSEAVQKMVQRTIFPTNAANAPMTDIQVNLLQLFRLPWPTSLGALLRNTLPCGERTS